MNGCCGRMGHTIAKMCQRDNEFRIVAGCDVTTSDDLNFPIYSNPNDCVEDFDVIIDFSNAIAVPAILNYALTVKKPFICCTTALSDDTVADILKASETIPVFKSANMSVGINLMLELVKKCTKTLYPEFDIEIVEAHHNRKLDAPSGTAMMIAKTRRDPRTRSVSLLSGAEISSVITMQCSSVMKRSLRSATVP